LPTQALSWRVHPQFLGKLAGQTAQILNINKAASDLRLTEDLVRSHTKLLEDVFLVYRLPAWGRTLIARTSAHPKIHVMDSGIVARLLRLTPERLVRLDAASMTEFGHLLETFVVGELMKHVSWLDGFAGVGHWRTWDDDEIDLVIERDDGAIVAFKVKTSLRAQSNDFKPMRKLRDKIGNAFLAGVTLYLGEYTYTVEDRLQVMPVDRLWVR
jgi:predicted AAA+ superfamily ATPase